VRISCILVFVSFSLVLSAHVVAQKQFLHLYSTVIDFFFTLIGTSVFGETLDISTPLIQFVIQNF